MVSKSTNSASRILNVIKQASAPHPSTVANVLHGEVISVNPLQIKIDNRLIITEDFILLGAMCREMIIKIPTETIVKHLHTVPLHTTDQAGSPFHTHTVQPFQTLTAMPEIRLWRDLIVGDNVMVHRVNNGQTYYVSERVEGIPWYPTNTIPDNT